MSTRENTQSGDHDEYGLSDAQRDALDAPEESLMGNPLRATPTQPIGATVPLHDDEIHHPKHVE